MSSTSPKEVDERPQTENEVGPHPSFIFVPKQYISQQEIQECLASLGSSEAQEVNIRMQGVMLIDSVRKKLLL